MLAGEVLEKWVNGFEQSDSETGTGRGKLEPVLDPTLLDTMEE